MKKLSFSKLMISLLMTLGCLGLAACSNDDEPKSENKALAEAIERLYANDGDPSLLGAENGSEIIYIAPAASKEDAAVILGYYLTTEVTSDEFIREFDTRNSIRVSPGEEGVFYNVAVNFENYSPFSFQVVPMEWLENENGANEYYRPQAKQFFIICLDCGKKTETYEGATNLHCPKCGSKHITLRCERASDPRI